MSAMQELMERVVERENLKRAYARVVSNGGSPGVDAMPVVDLDLEKFFDRVQHDVLMAKVARKVGKYFDKLGLLSLVDQRLKYG